MRRFGEASIKFDGGWDLMKFLNKKTIAEIIAPDGKWHHYAIQNKDGEVKCWIDGKHEKCFTLEFWFRPKKRRVKNGK